MFEAHVLHLLRKYLGEYVHGLSTEALRISVWKGDVILKDLKLKAEALNSLKLPVTVTAGFVGTITLKVPWKSLGKEPVVVLIDRVFILAHPAPDGQSLKEEDRERIFEAKLRQIEEAELATLEATSRGSKAGNPPGGSSWLSSLIATIIGNLKITLSNVHVRYEDSVSNPGHPFCSGVTLAKLAAVTTDELGNETFDTSGALDKLQKSLYLQRLAVYHDSDCSPWKAQKKWEELNPKEWVEIFADGINEIDDEPAFSSRAKNRQYLVSPINGVLKYHRLGKEERHEPNLPFEKASLVLADVSLTILETQYYDGIKLLETFSRYKTRVDVSHLRPVVSVSKHAHLWWRYAVQASLQQKKMCYRFSWERIRHLCHLRRCYVQLYASSLQHCTKADSCQLRQIERDLDSKVILLWRLLAHAKVESVKSKEATLQSGALKRSWWSFGWGGAPGDASVVTNSAGTLVEEKLSKEEWQVLNKMLSYELDEDTLPVSGKGMQIMIQFLVDISIEKAATRIVSIDQTEVLCGRFEQLRVTTRLYHKSTHCEVSLQFCGLSSPEGYFAQSVSNENKEKALAATFIHSPVGDKVDWSLSATIAPCHVTVDMKSYERFVGFMKRSNAVSPMVTLETATALQMKIEQVTRRAQEQFQMVIKEQSRFSLDIDFDAPKVRIPFGDCSSDLTHGNFLLDFGHFTLHTQEREHEQKRESIYSRFNILGRDIAAFFLDGCSEDCRHSILETSDDQPSMTSTGSITNVFHSLIDRCRMSVVVDQVKVPHPSYPSTRVSIEIPNLGIHFSPTRYQRIFELLNIFYRSTEANDEEINDLVQPDLAPWYPADLASEARILVWRGIGSSLAEWRPCFLVLSGVYLYVLESETSQSYQRCCSLVGRHVFEVSPASVGGSLFSIAASLRGTDIQKALESSSTLIVEFRGEVEKATWLKGLVHATYQASAFPLVYIPEKISNDMDDARALPCSFPRADLVIKGSLFEAKLLIYGKLDRNTECSKEELFLEILAGGGKVNLLRSSTDLSFKMKLHFLKIRDILQGHNSASLQYLACSVVKHDLTLSHACALRPSNIALHDLEEDDVFRDALTDFVGTSDQNFDDHSMDMVAGACSGYMDDCELFTQSIFVDDKKSGNARSFRKSSHAEIFYEAEDDGSSDFVVVTFMTRYPDSPLYDGTDTQMSICMSKLDFFCNRPTLVALLDFGFDISLANLSLKSRNGVDITTSTESSHDRERAEDIGRAVVKGLLGYGKRRILFHLRMIVDSVYMFLNREDGSQFAVFVQEKFLFDFKSHPSSISLEGTLGNFRLCDMSLGPDHWWGWLCNVRDQRNESLIKFIFRSFSADDDDYAGHDYSLSGELSAVRIVFLYRFVQEVMAYFMELATPHTEEVIQFVDKVGGFEWLIKKYEIDGSSSLKLNLSLDTPVIVVPYNSMSKSFLQLDLGKLHITNSFRWHGEEKDPSAVRLDILHAEMRGINLAVGLNGNIGEPMIKEGQWLTMEVRRSLRDVFRKVPTACVEVKVGSLHCVMSDKEYSVIRDCAYTNIYELPNLPPSFRGNTNATKESIRLLADKVNFNSQILLSRTIVIMAVDVQHALLELRNGRDEESPLAQIVLEGLWVSYRYSSLSEADLYVSIPKFSILDIRSDIKPEMRLMLGSSSDAYKQGLSGNPLGEAHSLTCSDVFPFNSRGEMYNDGPNLTMLIMDYRWRSSSQSFVIRMQQPRVLVVLDFLVAVTEFFVPSLRSLTGREESVDPKNDPLIRSDNIIISEPIHKQSADVICLSPTRKLIVDGPGFDVVEYDGCGGTILLNEESGMQDHVASGCCKFPFIIIVGRGKRLRFKNVKIENGDLLSKYTYLCNDSSYSVSTDDGVEIFFPDNYSADVLNVPLIKSQHLSACTDDSNVLSENNSSNIQSFSFEAQALSPELTFYDSTRAFLDDVTHMEKLLRAKMDFSFMYASKGYDIWVRSHVKDLTVEAGSGLAVLDPVDISGGYTSVKDKTNISIGSTDICIHLSLSVASLILHLQHQAFTALQFGNMDPATSCTNFKKIWVSQKGNKYGHKLTFWRPQAPPNYAILGDCVTSRPIAPSQIVMVVSNSYGRLRKPLGFKLLSFISDMMELDEEGCQSKPNSGCSIWFPIAPPGYLAMGCVAHVGRQAPPNHIVYCIRSDLVTSARFSECMATIPPSHSASSGFSIWRVDNVACSFAAYTSAECPSMSSVFDLHHILLGNTDIYSLTTRPSLSSPNQHLNGNQHGDEPISNLSGWDVLRSFSKPGSCYISTPHFERIWWDKGCDLRKAVSFWRPLPRQGFCVLGDCLTEGLEPPTLGLLFKCDSSEISAKPMQFTRVAHVARKGLDDAYFWYPVPPPGYASLGCIITKTDEAPNKDSFCCPRMDLISQSNISEYPFSRSSSSKGSNCWSVWKVENQANTFLARPDHKRPSSRLAYGLSDYVKPKTRENISAEMKIGSFSLTILDGLCGMMTPLFDSTITNFNLATHGRLEAMNAVLICSVAASTFNRQLEAWEPLLEPFEGIFKVETYEASENALARVGKRIRIAATSIVNLNLSAGNLETLVESVVSWRKQADLEQRAMQKSAELDGCKATDDSAFSALDEDDLEKVTLENKLGCDLYVKNIVQGSESVVLLSHGNEASVSLPPPRFSDKLNIIAESMESRTYVAIKIFHAKGLPVEDDGNGLEYFCALRLVTESSTSVRNKLFPQSARTRCLRPSISKVNGIDVGTVKWNEIFLFEVPEKVPATLELEITNLASKTGKGEVVGAMSIPIRSNVNTLKRVGSIRMLLESNGTGQKPSYTLRPKGQISGNLQDCGNLYVSTAVFERSSISNFQGGFNNVPFRTDKEVGFSVGLSPEGPWESFGSFLPLSVFPKLFDEKALAFEVTMQNGHKHAIFRPLALIVNYTNVKLEVSLCSASRMASIQSEMRNDRMVKTEEIFENQWYEPTSGWGSKCPSPQLSGLARWSTRDFSYSSKDFLEIPLPVGWRWTSAWTIEKTEYVDGDGWAYGTDLHSITWPPSSLKSSKSAMDFFRRRRWVRTREQMQRESLDNMSNVVAVVSPGSSASLPWSCMMTDADICLQIRPYDEISGFRYSWGQMLSVTSTCSSASNDSSVDQGPFSRQNTLKNNNFQLYPSALMLNRLGKMDLILCCDCCGSRKQHFWLTVGIDASVLQTEVNVPVYDWKINVNTPLRIENKLPYPAEISIWENVEGNNVERQYGIVPSGNTFYVYSADLRKPIYLTLLIQSDWVLEKDTILILDLLSWNHASSFWMVHKKSKRRLRVSVEHDLGGCIATPKIIRLFVPYWIQNESSVPLSYRIVEVDSWETGDADSLSVSKAVKSARSVLRHTSSSISNSRKYDQILEVIEEPNSPCIMFSPQDYSNRVSRNESLLSQRVGISIAVCHSECYGLGISLHEFENKERVDVKAFTSNGAYYKLSAVLSMAFDRTKVVCFQPYMLFINRVGFSICLKQADGVSEDWLHPTDPLKLFQWQYGSRNELLKVRLDGYRWSSPFSVKTEGLMCISLRKDDGNEQIHLWTEVQSGFKGSRYEVVFRPASYSSPYRIENRSVFLSIRFRQVDCLEDSWRSLPPNSSASFCWEDLGGQQLLEVLVDGTDPSKSEKYNIDIVRDYQPVQTFSGPMKAIYLTVLKDGRANVVRIDDWRPQNQCLTTVDGSFPAHFTQSSELHSSDSDGEFHMTLELAELGFSIVDHTPEEIMYLSVQNLFLSFSTGLGSGVSRFNLRIVGLQVDNQLPFTPMPVLFRPQRIGDEADDYVLKLSLTMQSSSQDLSMYPFIGMQGPESSAFLVNIHEPIIWRLHEMVKQAKLSRMYSTQTTAVPIDPIVQIRLLNISEFRFKLSMSMSPNQRPGGVLGFWSSLMTALGNMENMTVRINQRCRENVCTRQSTLISSAISNIQKDLLSQPLRLLSGVDILGNASSALGHMSKGVAALSMDKKFIQSRQKQESKTVEDFGDVIREGGGALAKGLFRGVTGILTKPLEGAKSSGVEGFVQGVGKGIIGVAAQPVSGVLDLLSKTTEGANAVRMKIASAITSEEQLLRRRLPRAIGGDNLLKPYDEYKASGQAILQLAESGAFFGQVDLFKVRGKFALSDAYEDHYLLPKGKVLLISHRRVLQLQQPTNIVGQRKFNSARDPCSVLWDVLWDDLMSMELAYGNKDPPASPSRLILYSRMRPTDSRENIRVIKCRKDSRHANDIYTSVERAMNTYGPNRQKREILTKPYTPSARADNVTFLRRGSNSVPGIHEVPSSLSMSSTFGTINLSNS